MQPDFGPALKRWRTTRRLSQLDLAMAANVSARHISFLETGRARPSSQMVVQLAETLQVPRAARNRMLAAAGHADLYKGRAQTDADLAPVRSAMRRMIALHDPLPAFVLDRHWRIVAGNQGFKALAAAFGLDVGGSLLDALLDLPAPQALFENWAEFGIYIQARLRTESAHLGGDAVLDAAADRLAADPTIAGFVHDGVMPAVIPTRLRQGDTTLSFISTIAQIGSTEDIVLADLKIEMLFPADAETAQIYGVAFDG